MQRFIGLWMWLLVLVTGCGAPVLRNAWRPDPSAVAFGTAAVATVISLLDPEGHRRSIEKAYLDAMPEERPMRVTEVVTAEVLDRLDAIQAQRYASR
jgi:hypothetical protein